MNDSVGVNRIHCKDCGVDESSDYKIKKNTDVCRYCGCYPVNYACEDPGEDNASKEAKLRPFKCSGGSRQNLDIFFVIRTLL